MLSLMACLDDSRENKYKKNEAGCKIESRRLERTSRHELKLEIKHVVFAIRIIAVKITLECLLVLVLSA